MHSQNLWKSSNFFANFWDVDSSTKQTKQIVHNWWTCYERLTSLLSDTFGVLHSEALWICLMMGKFWSCLVRMHVPPFTMESIKALEHGFSKTRYYKDLDAYIFLRNLHFTLIYMFRASYWEMWILMSDLAMSQKGLLTSWWSFPVPSRTGQKLRIQIL